MFIRILTLLILLFSFNTGGFAQSGVDKPVYEIITYRDTTLLGSFTIELFPSIAPLHVNNFDSLVNVQFFDSTAFHRVVPGFVIQGGDPNSINGPISTWGQGQPWQPTVPAEFNPVKHFRGILGAARDTNINSANSQFYICVANSFFLDQNYTVYGKVTSGMNIVDTIVFEPADINDVPLKKISMFVTKIGVNDSIPAAPVLTAPADQSGGVSNLTTFSWGAVPGAMMYTLEVASDSLFTNIVSTKRFGQPSGSGVLFPGSASYYWRVNANNGGHISAWSPVWKFNAVTDSAELISPADSAQNLILNPVFTWHSVAGADNYLLQVSKFALFAPPPQVQSYFGITDTTYQIPPLLPNTQYFWRVRSYAGAVAGFNSRPRVFVTGTALSTEETGINIALQVYPNPARNQVTIRFEKQPESPIRITVSDITGKTVYEAPVISFPHIINTESWEKGLYMIRAGDGGQYPLVVD